MWFMKAIAKGNGTRQWCYADLTGSYVFPTLFAEYPVFTIYDMELPTMDIVPLLEDNGKEKKEEERIADS